MSASAASCGGACIRKQTLTTVALAGALVLGCAKEQPSALTREDIVYSNRYAQAIVLPPAPGYERTGTMYIWDIDGDGTVDVVGQDGHPYFLAPGIKPG